MHEAEQYLRDPQKPSSLYIRYQGKRRRIFINSQGQTGIIKPGKRTHGTQFTDWGHIEKIYLPVPKASPEELDRRLVLKYQREAAKATFSSPFIRHILAADPGKSLYENHITTGNSIDGEIISLKAVRKWCGEYYYRQFVEAVRTRTAFHSGIFDFQGYDGSLWVEPYEEGETYKLPGEINAGFSKEYRNCGNGYYYLLINENNFIGNDVD